MIATRPGSPRQVIRTGNPNWKNWINSVAKGQQLDWGPSGNPIAKALFKEASKRFPGIVNWGSFAQGGHMPNSQHYRGNAIDINVPDTRTGLQFFDWLEKNKSRFGHTRVIYEPAGVYGVGDHSKHLHIDWGPRSGGFFNFNPADQLKGVRALPRSYWTGAGRPAAPPARTRTRIIRMPRTRYTPPRPAPRPRYNYGYSTYRPAPPRGRTSYGTPQRRPTKSVARTYKGAVKRYF